MGSLDGRVFLHVIRHQYAIKHVLEMPTRNVGSKRIDFSSDSNYVRISTESEECFSFKTVDGAMVLASQICDVTWASNHCPYTWGLVGMYSCVVTYCESSFFIRFSELLTENNQGFI